MIHPSSLSLSLSPYLLSALFSCLLFLDHFDSRTLLTAKPLRYASLSSQIQCSSCISTINHYHLTSPPSMDSEDPSTSSPSGGGGNHRKSVLLRSATWTARSSPRAHNPNPQPAHAASANRPPKPGRLSIPALGPRSGWPRPASDDSGVLRPNHQPPSTPSASHRTVNADGNISLVDDHLYIGSDAAARDRAALRRHCITHVLNCVGAVCPEYFRGEGIAYMTLWLHDSPAEDITSVLYDAFDYIEAAREASGRVLVHCVRGASRSATIATAYMMWRHGLGYEDALRTVQAARSIADPNLGFAAQLLQCQRRVLARSPSDSTAATTPGGSSLRVYRMTPHSPYDPLHLVPKSVELKAIPDGFLDSRGAFILQHVPSTIYIWLGLACDPTMAAAAKSAADQVMRYERAEGPIVTIREGSEPAEFWEAIRGDEPEESNDLRGVAGKRRLELYDLDYEIFRRALKGGVVPPVSAVDTETRVPARETGWCRLRSRFVSTGVKELVRAVVECGKLEEEDPSMEANETFLSPGSLSPETSRTPSPSSTTDCASTLSTFSPNSSSSSDWYNLSPPRTELYMDGKAEDVLLSAAKMRTIAERRGSNAPPLISLPPIDDESDKLSPEDIVRDWCLSPPFIPDVEDEHETINLEHRLSLEDPTEPEDVEENENWDGNELSNLIYPTLFRLPSMDEVEDINSRVLESNSIFLLLAPDSRWGIRRPKASTVYIWVGRDSRHNTIGGKEVDSYLDTVGTEFFERMQLPTNIPVQIIREGQEPEEFLNHLFSFHQVKKGSN